MGTGKLKNFMKKKKLIISAPQEYVERKILLVRGKKVMLDRDLAELYRVETAQLKRQVRRNMGRFPEDFMFVLDDKEVKSMVCHFGIPSKSYFGGANPFVFSEQGVAMLSSVLNSKRAIQVNIQIMRAFVKLREVLATHRKLQKKIEEHDRQIKYIFDILQKLLTPPEEPKRKIGFQP